MPGRNNASNKFGWSPFVVGTILGDGCNYTSVQQAIDDAFAIGGGVIVVRSGLYVENLIFRAKCDLYGAGIDGRTPSSLTQVVIQGNHTFSNSASFDIVIVQNISFTCLAGDAFTLNSTISGATILAMKFSGIEAVTDPASRSCVLNSDASSACQFSTDNTNISATSHCFECAGAGSHSVMLSLGNATSLNGNVFEMTSGSANLSGFHATLNSNNFIANYVTPNAQSTFHYTDLSSGNEAIFYTTGGGSSDFSHCNVSCNAPSGFFLDGVSGQYTTTDVVLTGNSIRISGTLTESFVDWKPYATAGVAPGTNVRKGTACFDDSQFSVTNGFVHILAPTGITWSDQGVTTLVTSNSGSFVTAAISLVLPLAPTQGDTCEFKLDNAGPLIIQANGTQTLRVASQVSAAGGTATSTLIGDAMTLTYRAATDTWIADSIIGNWLVL